jgi:hypothetical protein
MEVEMRHSAWYVATQSLLSFCLILFAQLSSHAESQCPGNAASITPRFVQHTLIIIPVKMNGQGPFDFIVDTGSQLTVIDPALATQLKLNVGGTIGVATVGSRVRAPMGEPETMEADSQIVEKPLVVVQDLGQLQAVDPHIRGMIGENFLAHFDVFIDYTHKMLCLDATRQMQQTMRGERILLVAPQDPEDDLSFAPRLVISVQLSNAKGRRLLLRLDSGTNAPMLFAGNQETPSWMRKRLSHQGRLAGRAEQAFDLLPPRDLRIGNLTLRQVSFVTPVNNGLGSTKYEQDGLLPTVLFRRVFISFADHLVVFDPEW